ncbi:MAG TPA: aminotransferase class V-fold PLP-dependent enzyme [Gemmatimonadaceae bacterium]|jgi:glutamate/tyrosine decarboxylase-like PLP-dependent enzyme|nr:aminotransferase class V-fold PLP-dependent enzyme [Gemmatimonadaceae bacterium]
MPEAWISPLEVDLETMRAMAARVSELVTAHLASLREQPVRTSLSRRDSKRIVGAIAPTAPEQGIGFDRALDELAERVLPYHAREPHPRFLGYVPSIPTFPSVLGDWLATGYNIFAGVWPIASGPNEIELVVLDWFRQWLGMPNGASGLLTSGGSTATLMAVVAARHARVGEDAALLPRLTLYTSTQAHSAVARAAWMAGISRKNVRVLPTDDCWRLRADTVQSAVAADRAAGLVPFCVVASAGTTNTGAVDDLSGIAELCEHESLWLHVDAAYGAFAAVTSRGGELLQGIERADSLVLDPHKWLFVPFECAGLLARDPGTLKSAFHIFPEYLKDVAPGDEEVNFADYGEQLSRYSRALKIWLSVRTFGLAPIRAMIERGITLAEYAETIVRREESLEVLSPAQLGILCFRVHPRGVDDRAELDALNELVNARVNERFLISSTKVNGMFSLRMCTHNWRTSEADIDQLMALVAEGARDSGPGC